MVILEERIRVIVWKKCVEHMVCGGRSKVTWNNIFENIWDVKKVKGLALVSYVCQTQEQQRFTVSEVTADWRELLVPQHIMQPSIAKANRQLDIWCLATTLYWLQPRGPEMPGHMKSLWRRLCHHSGGYWRPTFSAIPPVFIYFRDISARHQHLVLIMFRGLAVLALTPH